MTGSIVDLGPNYAEMVPAYFEENTGGWRTTRARAMRVGQCWTFGLRRAGVWSRDTAYERAAARAARAMQAQLRRRDPGGSIKL